jgi:concanavalin A-like lectin/glucanase superfamily protein
MKRLGLCCLFASAAFAQCTGYTGSLIVDINRLKVPASETSFTVLLHGTNATLATQANGGQLQSGNGYDVCYSNVGNSSSYTWRLMAYTAATGFFSHRVLLPTVNGNDQPTDTQFLLWYGKAGQSAPSGNPFDSHTLLASDFGNGSTLDLTDWTGHCTSPLNHSTTATTGPIAGKGAINLNGSQYVDWGSGCASTLNPGTGQVTMAMWVNLPASSGLYVAFQKLVPGGQGGYHLYFGNLGGLLSPNVEGLDSSGNLSLIRGANAFAVNTWHYIVGTFDSLAAGHIHAYLDGVNQTFATSQYNAATLAGSGANAYTGIYDGSNYWYVGKQASLRVTNAIWDANMNAAVYNNESSPSTFFSFVAAAPPPNPITDSACSANSPTSILCTWSTGTTATDSQVICGTSAGDGTYPSGTLYQTPVVHPVKTGDSYFGTTTKSIAITGLPNNTSSTAYYCVTLSKSAAGVLFQSAEKTSGTTAVLASTPFKIQSVSAPTRPNDQFNGSNGMSNTGFFVDGDTNYCSLRSDGKTICTCEDCRSVGGTHDNNTNLLLWSADHLSATHITGYTNSYPRNTGKFGGVAGGILQANGSTYFADGLFNADRFSAGFCCEQFMRSKDGFATSIGLHHNTGSGATGVSGVDLAPGAAITAASVAGTTVTLTTNLNVPVGTPIMVNNVVCSAGPCINTGAIGGTVGLVSIVTASTSTQLTYEMPGATGAVITDVSSGVVNVGTFNGLLLVHWIQCDGAEYNCTKYAGMDGWVYAFLSVGTGSGGPDGIVLGRIRIEDLDLLDWGKWQIYKGTRTGDDGLYDVNWDSSSNKVSSSAVAFTEQPFYWLRYGTCKPSAAFVQDFNRWLLGCGIDAYGGVASAGAGIYDLQYPWSIPNYAGQILRDLAHYVYYMPAFPTLLPGSYHKLSSSPLVAAATVVTSGVAAFYVGNPNGANDNYTTWLRRVTLVPAAARVAVSRIGQGPRRHNSTGLDVAYFFTDNITGSRTLQDGAPLAKYTVTDLPDAGVLNIDQYGLYNGGMPVSVSSNGVWQSPRNYALTTSYKAQLNAFTNATCFGHVPGSSIQPNVSGEIVVSKSGDFQIARHGATDTWDVIVKGATIGAVPIADNTFGCIVTIRDGSGNVKVYKSGDIGSTLPLTATATGAASGAFSNSALVLGDASNSLHGIWTAEIWWNRVPAPDELVAEMAALRLEMAGRGAVIP